jgi:hypothetical protein
MMRSLIVAAVVALARPVYAGAPGPIPHPIEAALSVPDVIVGKITSIEPELVDAAPDPGLPKVGYRVAVVKIGKTLAGAAGLTHLKVGFVPPVKPALNARRPDRRERPTPELKEGREMMFFLSRHPDGVFYAMPNTLHPIEASSVDFKVQVESVSTALAAVANPDRALTAGTTSDRFHAALALISKYRLRDGTRDVESVPINADENRLILKALAEGDWKNDPTGVRLSGFVAIYRLGLSEAEGWTAPGGKPGEEYTETMRKAFIAWLTGPGKDYRIKKLVPKK